MCTDSGRSIDSAGPTGSSSAESRGHDPTVIPSPETDILADGESEPLPTLTHRVTLWVVQFYLEVQE